MSIHHFRISFLLTTLLLATDQPEVRAEEIFVDPASDNWIQPVSMRGTSFDEPCRGPCCDDQSGASTCCCGDDFLTRASLTNGFWGAGQDLAEQGILANLQMTHFYQGVSSGGREQDFAYGGKADYMFTFLGGRLGLNEGFTAIMHAETRWGEDVNVDAGAFAFPNTNMLYPFPGTHQTSITGLMFIQALSERFALTAGKYNLLDMWNMIYPNTGRGIDGFMNLSMIAPVPLIRTTNLSINGAGAMVMEGKQIQGALLVYDTNNSSTTVGLDDLFDQGAVVLGYWRCFTELGGLPGSHAVLGNWSSRTFTSLDPTSWTIVPGQGVVPGQNTGSWTIGYVLDQMVWADSCNANRHLSLMSQWMIADGDPNFYHWSGNVALQGNGLIQSRPLDTMGVGYFYAGLSSDFIRLVSPVVTLQDAQGAELYYNAAITPWFHLTADLQVVDNSNSSAQTAIIPGLRANIQF